MGRIVNGIAGFGLVFSGEMIAATAHAQGAAGFPSHSIRIVVRFTPGGMACSHRTRRHAKW
ncbi:MAG TPA: hypothetical protein VK663_09790, partial [Burkholderiales bacterium]|nr:hypothetical protein [Burkholderiales bacterium]